ncbi:MAG: GNAT family N-acetyltransferase [Synergistes sp.]|nr:GNAT family N-acetyltransferase [Synergistes sp.]MCR5336495.1 GNAT family N-acetyltransferase [Synergistes sp.]
MKINVRAAEKADIAGIAAIEKAVFPPEEALSEETFKWCFASFPEGFAVAESAAADGGKGETAAAIVCRPTALRLITDEIYERKEISRGDTFAIMTFIVAPHLQRQGLGDKMLEASLALFREKGAKNFSLACKEHLKAFYRRHGFIEAGLSRLTLGGAVWYDMYLTL